MAIELTELNRIFRVEHGSKLDLNKMDLCAADAADAVAFVGRSGARNGLAAVALGGSALSSFVQPREFYTAQNIDVLRPLSEMSLDTKLFYCLCIEANRFRYSTYGREANRTLKTLRVPALSSVPGWVEGSMRRAASALARDVRAVLVG
jgi:hypothetical protein